MLLKKKIFAVIFSAMFFISTNLVYAENNDTYKLTLNKAIEMAFENNNDIKLAESQYNQLEALEKQSTASYDSARHNNSSYAVSYSTLQSQISTLQTQINTLQSQIATEANPTTKLQLENQKQALELQVNTLELQLNNSVAKYISTASAITPSEKQAEYYRESKENAYKQIAKTKDLVEYNVEKAYLSAIVCKNTKDVLQQRIEIAEKLLRIERLRLELGIGTKTSLEALTNSYLQLRNEFIKANDTYEMSLWQVNNLIGQEVTQQIELQDVTLEEIKLYTKEIGLENAINESLDLSSKEKNVEDMQDEYEDDDTKYYQISKTNLEKAEIEFDNAKFNLKSQYEQASNKYKVAKEELEIYKSTFEHVKSNLEIGDQRLSLGMIAATDYEQLKIEFEISQYNFKTAEYNYYLAAKEYYNLQQGNSAIGLSTKLPYIY